ncbi:hypothetical protein L915_13368 [Phytophthora nicotianae]|uniref:Uncharacterized protein n=1 Tax=Phytophthora nicotianae TaxID=4792 RepID=W2GFQ8_PHYNI|nr:hypothetical protein L915_13368 [Phytophthora nicotianae]
MITAYHVSSSSHSDPTFIQSNVCDDVDCDQWAFGLRAACFSTTLYNTQLPTLSPYPRNVEKGSRVYRSTMTFDPNKSYKFKMADTQSQVYYLLRRKRDKNEMHRANFMLLVMRIAIVVISFLVAKPTIMKGIIRSSTFSFSTKCEFAIVTKW